MRNLAVVTITLSLTLLGGCNESAESPEVAGGDSATTATPAAPDLTTAEGKIASATSAGPSEISAQAAVMDFGADGMAIELRPGTNGWMCMADLPSSPGTDPMCVDSSWQAWLTAYMAKEPPNVTGVGIAYMLMGGSDASNTDPFATEPAAGGQWVDTGPHIMVIPPNVAMLDAFPAEHGAGGPWVMWKGTPYAHLMVPIGSSTREAAPGT